MRTLLIFLLLISFSYSQAQTTTEKYNSYLERYEYFNSKGTMIGYKKYNSYLDQWEYTKVNSSSTSSGYYDNIPVYEPNYELINKALATKEANYANNEAAFEQLIKEIGDKLRSYYGVGTEGHTKALERFKFLFDHRLDKWTNSYGNIDLANANVWRGLRNDIVEAYNTTLKYIPRESESTTKMSNSYSTAPREKYSSFKYSGAKLRAEPNVNSRITYQTDKLERVKILHEESSWVKVEVNNRIGYISKAWLTGYQTSSANSSTSSSNKRFKYTGAKLRSQPNVDSALVYTSDEKENVRILQKVKNSNWIKVEVNGNVGFITDNWIE